MINYFRILIFVIFALGFSLEAAAPGSHLFFAEWWIDANGIFDQNCRDEFIIGNLFPDIRYLGTVKRRMTHVKGVNKDDIKNADSYFRAGILLHSFVDEEREKFVKKYKIFKKLDFIPKKGRVFFLKLLEDEILWENINLPQAQSALESIYPEEADTGVDLETINEWHSLMIDYFKQKPSVLLKNLKEKDLGFLHADKETVAKWSEILPILAKDPDFIQYMEKLIAHFDRRCCINHH
ncbi:MAG: hypothetical protein K940chlam7_00652 [Chlamydiae bacterium]|nr:hypothetical protein [Chlamydiota bacterium]